MLIAFSSFKTKKNSVGTTQGGYRAQKNPSGLSRLKGFEKIFRNTDET